ncbi:MAG: RNA polymerase sigma factor [Chloroflexota bacterium]
MIDEMTKLYMAHQQRLIAYLMAIVRDQELAEDLCQETFVKALRHWTSRSTDGSVVGWLYRIARNTALDEVRRRRRLTFTPLDETIELPSLHSVADEVGAREQEATVGQLLTQIPRVYREAFLLYVYYDYSIQEIAVTVGCSRSAAKGRVHRARGYLRSAYQQELCEV